MSNINIMELFDTITLFGVLGVVSTIGMVLIFRLIPRKSPKKIMESELLKLQKAYSITVDEIIARHQALNKSIQSENNRLKKELSGDSEDGEEETVDISSLLPLVKGIFPQMDETQLMALANMPQVKKLLGNKKNLEMISGLAPLLKGMTKPNEVQNVPML